MPDVAIHHLFAGRTSQARAMPGVLLDVGIRGGVPAPLMACALRFASRYHCEIRPQGGSHNVVFVGGGCLAPRELHQLGLLMKRFVLAVFLVVGAGWILLTAG